MKDSCIKNFSFLPSDYDCMVNYLNEMLEEGWRLKWVKAGFAGFDRKDSDEHITYVVEPYPNTNLITLRRMPKTWLNFYTQNNWYFLGKSRGNFIYFTNLEEPKAPSNTSSMGENDSKIKVISAETMRNAALLVAIFFIIFKLLSSKKFMYAYVLTNLFQYLTVILAVLIFAAIAIVLLYALETVRVGSGTFSADSAGGLRRGMLYHIRNFSVILLAIVFFVMETIDKPIVLLYIMIPVIALLIGGTAIVTIIKKRSKKADYMPGKDLMPMALGFGAVVMVLLMFSMTQIQNVNKQYAENAKVVSIERADTLPLLRYKNFFTDACTPRSKENNSYMGMNYLFEEANEDRSQIVFNNHTEMKSKFGANKIYDYLYYQAQADYVGTFEEIDPASLGIADNTVTINKINNSNSYLIRKGNAVTLTTITGNVDTASVGEAIKDQSRGVYVSTKD